MFGEENYEKNARVKWEVEWEKILLEKEALHLKLSEEKRGMPVIWTIQFVTDKWIGWSSYNFRMDGIWNTCQALHGPCCSFPQPPPSSGSFLLLLFFMIFVVELVGSELLIIYPCEQTQNLCSSLLPSFFSLLLHSTLFTTPHISPCHSLSPTNTAAPSFALLPVHCIIFFSLLPLPLCNSL